MAGSNMYTDGGHGGQEADAVLQEQQVTHIQTAIRGQRPNHQKLSLSDFAIQMDQEGKPVQITCPQKQQGSVHPSDQKKGFVAFFDSAICYNCPLWQAEQCPTRPRKRDEHHYLCFTQAKAYSSQRRRHSLAQQKEGPNLRAAIEATVRCFKHPFQASKLPVRGSFRMAGLLIGSAALANVRRIQHYLKAKSRPDQNAKSFVLIGKGLQMSWIRLLQPSGLYLGC